MEKTQAEIMSPKYIHKVLILHAQAEEEHGTDVLLHI